MFPLRCSLPRWQENQPRYTPFYCPDNPLPHPARRPQRPRPPPPLTRPISQRPARNPENSSSTTTSRRNPNYTLGSQVGRRPRYGHNPDETPARSTDYSLFSGQDEHAGVAVCTICCCFFFFVPSMVVIILANTSAGSPVSVWLGIIVAILCVIFLFTLFYIHCRSRLMCCKPRRSTSAVLSVSPPSYSYGSIAGGGQGDDNPPPQYTAHPAATVTSRAERNLTLGPDEPFRMPPKFGSGVDALTCPSDKPPTYDQAMEGGETEAREMDQFSVLD